MIKAVKIRMKTNCYNSKKLEEIDSIKLEGSLNNPGWFKKETIHDFIKYENGEIYVNIYPYPKLIAVTTQTEKYVKSTPNKYGYDNLLELPRE